MKKSSILFSIVCLLLIITTSVFAHSPVTKKYRKTYKCKLVGVQKVKPYFKKVRHFGYITGSKSKHKLG